MRGGTVLHKVHLAPPARYSEDIDLVATSARPEGHIRKALARVLGDVLGKPGRSAWGTLRLAVRNAARPSRVLRSTYDVPSVAEPGRTVRIVVETNVTERHSHRGIVAKDFAFELGGSTLRCALRSFDIHEIVADKMGIDIHEVIRAAATKPFGFVAYTPGPGLGGHCILIGKIAHARSERIRALSRRDPVKALQPQVRERDAHRRPAAGGQLSLQKHNTTF